MDCWQINSGILKFLGVYLRKYRLELGSTKPGVVRSAPPARATGQDFYREDTGSKARRLFDCSLGGRLIGESPVGCSL